jgi:uncharacterized protein YraI
MLTFKQKFDTLPRLILVCHKLGSLMKMPFRFSRSCKSTAILLLAAFLALGLPVLAQVPKFLKLGQPVKVYPDPDLSSPALGQAPGGAEAAVLRQVGDWYKVKVAGLAGWLHRGAVQASRAGDSQSLLQGAPVKEGGSEDVIMGVYGKKAGPPEPRDEHPRAMAEKAPPAGVEPEPPMASKAPPLVTTALQSPERTLMGPQAIYPEPDEAAGPLAQAPAGAKVTVVKKVGDWCKVKYLDTSGWLPAQALK